MSRKPSHSFKDQDYLDKLSPDERKWLMDFNAKHYDGVKTIGADKKQQKADNLRNAAANRDLWTQGKRVNAPADDDDFIDNIAFKTVKELSGVSGAGKERPRTTKKRHLDEEDYRAGNTDLENKLVEMIDLASAI